MKVDVAVNYYGKPYQTLLTLQSLLEHSGEHVDVIYLIREPRQPRVDEDVALVTRRFADRMVVFTPERYLGWSSAPPRSALAHAGLRRSLRYQFALEETDKRYLFITHNDVFYKADLVGELLRGVAEGPHAGAGSIGQCWNCPAYTARLCDSDRHAQLELSYAAALSLVARTPSPRTRPWRVDPRRPLPLPECRLNEFACLLDVDIYRRETLPTGSSPAFGLFGRLDLGSRWYRSMVHKGYTFANVHIEDYCVHGAGHPGLFDPDAYDHGEQAARAVLTERYGLGTVPWRALGLDRRREFRVLHQELVALERELALGGRSRDPVWRALADGGARYARDLARRAQWSARVVARRLPRGAKALLRAAHDRRPSIQSDAGGADAVLMFPDSEVAHLYLDGLAGIEIGASAHNPFHIPGSLNVDYTDQTTVFTSEQLRICGEAARVEFIARGDDLPFEDASLDFVLSSHVLEHFFDPIGAIGEWLRVVRPGGYLFMIIPHRDRTFDRDRALTSVDELHRRHSLCQAADAAGESIEQEDAHHSVWVTRTFLDLCAALDLHVVHVEDVDDKVGNGFTVVVRR